MDSLKPCLIHLRVLFHTKPGEVVKVTGNLEEFGNWTQEQSIELETSKEIYPLWITKEPIVVYTGKILS